MPGAREALTFRSGRWLHHGLQRGGCCSRRIRTTTSSAPAGPPLVVTLHLPASYDGPAAFAPRGELVRVCVSDSQRRSMPVPEGIEVIPNGVELGLFQARRRGRRYGLGLGRVCPEKGFARELTRAPG